MTYKHLADHASANEKFDWGIFGASVFVGKKTNGGEEWRRSRPTVVIGQRGGEHGGNTNGDMSYISSVNLGKGGY